MLNQLTTQFRRTQNSGNQEREIAPLQVEPVAIPAIGLVMADASEVKHFRTNPGDLPADRTSLLRHSECQTVLGLAAVLQAIESRPDLGPFDEWSVITSPCRPGRAETTAHIEKFHKLGVRGIGPHAIPTLSLHAAAATISICLAAHGPIFGVSGGPNHVADGLLAGLTAQLTRNTPGTWLVFSEWAGDDDNGAGTAIALGLTSYVRRTDEPVLMFRRMNHVTSTQSATLNSLAEFLRQPGGGRWDCPLDFGELSVGREARK